MGLTADRGRQLGQRSFLDGFRRVTSAGKFIPEIDGLRFLAILSVYLFHLAGDVLRHAPTGYSRSLDHNVLFQVTQVLSIGVQLFFVLSGFILGLPFAEYYRGLRQPVSLRKYFWRRLTRLEPPYILCLLLFFCLKIAAAKASPGGLVPSLLASIFYVHNIAFGRPSDIDFVAWSLEVEVQFYLLAPLLAMVFRIRSTSARRGVLVGAILLASGLSRLVSGHSPLDLSLLAQAQYFLAGFLLTEFRLPAEDRPGALAWDAAMLASWGALLLILVRKEGRLEWTFPWLLLLIFLASFRGVASRRCLRAVWVTTIGGMCYSIYLLHNYSIAAIGGLTGRLATSPLFGVRLSVQFLLITPLVLATGAIYFRLIERPCMRPDWPRRLAALFQRDPAREL